MNGHLLTFVFHGSLVSLVPEAEDGMLAMNLHRRASIKDILEACGIPHPEIGRIVTEGGECDFGFIPECSLHISVYPFVREIFTGLPTKLWPLKWEQLRFVVDESAGKLLRNLRVLGVDTVECYGQSLRQRAVQAASEQRILLTRNRDLLRCREASLGQLIRSEDHLEQLREVAVRYGLQSSLQPFARCLLCNRELEEIAKEHILERLEPLTKKYYHKFKWCPNCGKIFWQGSHCSRLREILDVVHHGS